jgi:spore maturation protein CgeB
VKILYVAMKYDYGRPEQGLSFEHHNFYESLAADGHELVYFDFMSLYQELGRDEMNRLLLETARGEQADLMFTVLFGDELDPEAVRSVRRETKTITLNWFCDDHWRFESFSARWAPAFDWVVTTASSAVPKYERIGYRTAIKSQWGCNHHLYRKLDVPHVYDVSFVGQPHGNRPAVIEALRGEGIDVYTRGRGWPEDRVSQEELIRIFNQSRINLNLPNASSAPAATSLTGRARSTAGRTVRSLPGGSRAIGAARASMRALRGTTTAVADGVWYPEQIKGRNFEVPGCGGFLLTGPADDLADYYEPGREVAVFDGISDLFRQIRHYLANENERRSIAEAGYARTRHEHTYSDRFAAVFATIGLGRHTAAHRDTPVGSAD